MRRHGWQGVRRQKTVRTTIADPTAVRPPDLVDRQWGYRAPNRLLVADVTYVKLVTGVFVYVAFVIDAHAGAVVGWEASASKQTRFVESALRVLGGDGEPEAVGDLGVLRVPSASRRGSGGSADDLAAAQAHGGSWRPLLAHLGSRPERSRRIRLRAERRIPDTLDAEQIAAIVAACDRLRDRFLFSLLASSGLRVGEALGLRHSDVDAAARLVTVVSRVNANRARAKGGGRQVPVPGAVIRLYADYLHGEYGELDSDYVFVNLWSGPIGCPLTYASVYDLVCRLRQRTGIMFGPHTFRHSYATELLRRKVPVEVVQHLLGHASIATTSDAYAHLKVEDARRALVAAGWLADRDGSW